MVQNSLLVKWLLFGSGEKHYFYVGFRYVISIKSLVFFGPLTYLIRYVRDKVYRDINIPNVPYKVRYNVPRDIR